MACTNWYQVGSKHENKHTQTFKTQNVYIEISRFTITILGALYSTNTCITSLVQACSKQRLHLFSYDNTANTSCKTFKGCLFTCAQLQKRVLLSCQQSLISGLVDYWQAQNLNATLCWIWIQGTIWDNFPKALHTCTCILRVHLYAFLIKLQMRKS